MNAISDRSLWLAHLRYCTSCPTNRCDRGDELAAAVRELLAPGEHWQGIYRPHATEHGPARAARERLDPDYGTPLRPWPAEPGGDYGGV